MNITPDLNEQEKDVVRAGLDNANALEVGPMEIAEFGLALRNDNGEVQGGVISSVTWTWLHVHILWVADELRGQGHGARLIRAAEAEGRRRGCRFAKLHTFSFQARPFYEKLGYRVIAETKDFPEGHSQFLMFREL